ncbi:M23 family metallopeptidase [Edaphobacter bradus]|uniref:M23 family metallopeptidase n=1 Tax=Edaphobacter bradus TaxID=2259016 RepID=UPI0021E0D6BD|nr:M23 family metallopeptidase [Edaphobacter bradus]
MSLKKRYYIMFVSRGEDGTINKVPVPLHYAYIFVAAAVIGMFTITGLAGSYSRMLIKTARFNQLRQDHNALQKDYAHLEQQAHEKDIRAASLGSLASEVSAIYGLTASKLAVPMGKVTGKARSAAVADAVATTPLTETASAMTDDGYYKSVDAFYSLRTSAMNGAAARSLSGLNRPTYSDANPFAGFPGGSGDVAEYVPSLWPVMGPITSSFGERDDPILGNGEGEFHKGLDISAPNGVPVRATADGLIKVAEMSNGYGREVVIDHGHGVETLYGHMSGFAVVSGQTVVRGQVIGYVGHSGRSTGSHLHYEVRIHNTPVNPHKYLRMTLADLGSEAPAAPAIGLAGTKAAGLNR